MFQQPLKGAQLNELADDAKLTGTLAESLSEFLAPFSVNQPKSHTAFDHPFSRVADRCQRNSLEGKCISPREADRELPTAANRAVGDAKLIPPSHSENTPNTASSQDRSLRQNCNPLES